MSKLTLHAQGIKPYYAEFLRRSGARYIKLIGNYPTYPGVVTIGRVFADGNREPEPLNTHIRAGASGADRVFASVWPEVEKNPQVGLWEAYNESSIWDSGVAAGFVAFNQRLIERFHAVSRKIIVGAINTGWPRLPSEDGGAMMRIIRDAARGADGLSFHEYGWEDMRKGATYQCLRYRRFHEYSGGDHPPLYITECGLDRTSPPGPDFGHSGWRHILNGNEQAYLEQLLWYEQELRKDDYVKCATIFTAAPSGWDTFDIYESFSLKLADALAGLGPGPGPGPDPTPSPPPPNGGDMKIKVFDVNGAERDMAWLVQNYGPIEVTGDGYAVTELREKREAPATLIVSVLDQNQVGKGGVQVNFLWPDGTATGFTNDAGDVGFGMGKGAYYFPPNAGPHWIKSGGVQVTGLGMIGGTNHNHIDVVFRQQEEKPVWNPLTGVSVYQSNSVKQTAQWAHEMFGYQDIHTPDNPTYRIIALAQAAGPVLRVFVVDNNTMPVHGVTVLLGSRAMDPQTKDTAITDAAGVAQFSMDDESFRYSAVDQQGPFAVAVQGQSEVYNSCGVVIGRNDHMDVVFRYNGVVPPVDDEMARGVDVSEYQKTIDWKQVAASGITFAFIRASVCRSDGTIAEDPTFKQNWEGAGNAGLLRGVYHYVGVEARGQARFFVNTVGAREPELGWWADLEHRDLDSGRCQEFLEAVDGNLGGRGICNVYSRANWLDAREPISWNLDRGLWVADWTGATEPSMPAAWDEWAFWQYSNSGSVPGIDARAMVDRYNGTVAQLYAEYGDGPINQYWLDVDVTGGGTVVIDPDLALYVQDEIVTLQAYPDLGWTFAGWAGDYVSTASTITIAMHANTTLSAAFIEQDGEPGDCCAEILDLMQQIIHLLQEIAAG